MSDHPVTGLPQAVEAVLPETFEIWRPTPQLRWRLVKFGDPVLEQAWERQVVDQKSRIVQFVTTEWRPVPSVDATA